MLIITCICLSHRTTVLIGHSFFTSVSVSCCIVCEWQLYSNCSTPFCFLGGGELLADFFSKINMSVLLLLNYFWRMNVYVVCDIIPLFFSSYMKWLRNGLVLGIQSRKYLFFFILYILWKISLLQFSFEHSINIHCPRRYPK